VIERRLHAAARLYHGSRAACASHPGRLALPGRPGSRFPDRLALLEGSDGVIRGQRASQLGYTARLLRRDRMQSPRISFEEFGVNFMDRVLTPKRVNDSVAAVLQKVKLDDLHGTRTIQGRDVRFLAILEPPETSRVVRASEMAFAVKLPVKVSIEVLALPDKPSYTLRVEVALALTATACAPLLIVITPEPLTPESVRVIITEEDEGFITWLVELFTGEIEPLVINGVRQTVTEIVSKTIAGAADAFTIDVEQMVNPPPGPALA
jgi:hypothetical protein